MDSCRDTPKGWVAPFGHPRINACSRLPVAFRSVPRPSSPPGAKASTECPYRARDLRTNNARRNGRRPSNPPCTGTIPVVGGQWAVVRRTEVSPSWSPHTEHRTAEVLPSQATQHKTHTPLNASRRRWRTLSPIEAKESHPVRQTQRRAPRDAPEPDSP